MSDEPQTTQWAERKARMQRDAVMATLQSLGFDTADVHELQQDILFLRRLRKAQETASAKTIAAFIGLLFAGLGGLLTLALQQFFNR